MGWSMGERMTAELVLSALNMPQTQRKPQDVIHHSDQGSQGGFNRSSQHLQPGGVYGTTRRMDEAVDGEDAMRSPGVPSLRREIEWQFWKQIAAQTPSLAVNDQSGGAPSNARCRSARMGAFSSGRGFG